jgi:quercetin dioxygenase-like cupin family protein
VKELRKWTSHEVARSIPAKDRPSILPERSGLTLCSRQTIQRAQLAPVSVTFEPGARTAWHTHPLGQTLIVTAGCGRVQRWGGSIEEIRPGYVIWFPPGEKHWHGGTPTTAMTHIAIQEQLMAKRWTGWKGYRRTIPSLIKKQCGSAISVSFRPQRDMSQAGFGLFGSDPADC